MLVILLCFDFASPSVFCGPSSLSPFTDCNCPYSTMPGLSTRGSPARSWVTSTVAWEDISAAVATTFGCPQQVLHHLLDPSRCRPLPYFAPSRCHPLPYLLFHLSVDALSAVLVISSPDVLRAWSFFLAKHCGIVASLLEIDGTCMAALFF